MYIYPDNLSAKATLWLASSAWDFFSLSWR